MCGEPGEYVLDFECSEYKDKCFFYGKSSKIITETFTFLFSFRKKSLFVFVFSTTTTKIGQTYK